MKYAVIMIPLLFLSSGTAYAEWVEVVTSDDHGGYTTYIDPDTLRRKGNLVKIWILYDFKAAQDERFHSYISVKRLNEYDCEDERNRNLAYLKYSGPMGTREVVDSYVDSYMYPSNWAPVVPDSVGKVLWRFVCGKQ